MIPAGNDKLQFLFGRRSIRVYGAGESKEARTRYNRSYIHWEKW